MFTFKGLTTFHLLYTQNVYRSLSQVAKTTWKLDSTKGRFKKVHFLLNFLPLLGSIQVRREEEEEEEEEEATPLGGKEIWEERGGGGGGKGQKCTQKPFPLLNFAPSHPPPPSRGSFAGGEIALEPRNSSFPLLFWQKFTPHANRLCCSMGAWGEGGGSVCAPVTVWNGSRFEEAASSINISLKESRGTSSLVSCKKIV